MTPLTPTPNHPTNRRDHLVLILVLGSLTAVGPFSIDMYLPGFPAIARDLQTDISHVALTLTSYFIGISVGQLGYGPLLDRFGRRKPVIAGLLLYIVAAVGCGLASTIHWLITLRFLLAIGSCVGIVAARAIVRDLFPLHEIAKVFSTLMLVLGVSPIIAPSVGAYVVNVWGWRGIFVVLAVIAILILAGAFRYLPESRPPDRSVSLRPRSMMRSYLQVLREPVFAAYGLASAAASAGLFAYISDSPFVFMKFFEFSEGQFGIIFGLSACGVIGASQLNRVWLRKRTSREVSLMAVLVQCAVAALLVAAAIAEAPAPVVIALMFCYLAGLGSLSPNTTAIAIGPFAAQAGTASALLGSLQMVGGALGSAMVSWFHNGTALPMAAMLMVSSGVSLGLQLVHRAWGKGRGR